ncbi:MAG: hypothetical protein HWD92_02610 [Flavobacteriia bacterium]|nr:hypothetical protein [Flavobacteriia bacterium]
MKRILLCLAGVLTSLYALATLNPGTVILTGLSDEQIKLYCIDYVPGGTEIHITERIYDTATAMWGASLEPSGNPGSGTITITAPAWGIPAGAYMLVADIHTASPIVRTDSGFYSDITVTMHSPFILKKGNGGDEIKLYTTTTDQDGTPNWDYVVSTHNTSSATEDYGDLPNNCVVNMGNNSDAFTINLNAQTPGTKEEVLDAILNGGSHTWEENRSTLEDLATEVNVVFSFTSIDHADIVWNGVNWVDPNDGNSVVADGPGTANDAVLSADYNTATDGAITVYSDLIIESPYTLTIDAETNNELNVVGDIIVEAGAKIVFEANANDYARKGNLCSIYQDFSGGGTVEVQVYEAFAGWQHISLPGSIPYSSISFTNGMSLDVSQTSSQNIYHWNESTYTWDPVASLNDNAGNPGTAIYFPASSIPTTMLIDYVADSVDVDIVDGRYTQSLIYYDSGSNTPGNSSQWSGVAGSGNNGWNYVKNPFIGYISSEDLIDNLPADVFSGVAVWDGENQTYVTRVPGVGAVTEIPPYQGVWVQLQNNTSPSLNITFRKRIAGTETYKSSQDKPQLAVTASSGAKRASAYLAFEENSTMAYDERLDMPMRFSGYGTPTVSWVSSDSIRLNIMQTPFPEGVEVYYLVIDQPDVTLDSIKLTFEGINLPEGTHLMLEDLHTGNVKYLNSDMHYAYRNDTSALAERFRIYVSNQRISLEEQANPITTIAYRMDNRIQFDRVETSGITELQVMDPAGRILMNTTVDTHDGSFSIPSPAEGVLFIYLGNDTSAQVLKII